MKTFFISQLVGILLNKRLADFILDAIEVRVKETESTADDAVILAVVNALRVALDIPDDDEPAPDA